MIPKIDPDVKYIGSSKLRGLTSGSLRELTGAIVVQSASAEPLAVILPYATYLAMQESVRLAIEGVARVIESSENGDGLAAALAAKADEVTTETRGPRQKGDKTR